MWNLSESDLLLTVSELSVAFAGFASLASILGRRFSKDDPRLDAGRLLNMLTASLAITVLSLVPLLPMLMQWSARWVWGASGVFGLAMLGTLSPTIIRRAARMRRYPGFSQPANALNYALFVVAGIGFASCAFGVPRANPFLAYFGSIVALLASCAILFFRVIASLLQPVGQESE